MAEKATRSALPRGVKKLQGVEIPLDSTSVSLMIEGWVLKQKADQIKALLEQINETLHKMHGIGCVLMIPQMCRATPSVRRAVTISDDETLRAVLEDRWGALVRETVRYTPSPRLLEMAADGDEPLREQIAECLSVSDAVAVSWRAEK